MTQLDTVGKYALVIGIRGYPGFDAPDRLKFADNDATDFAAFIESPSGGAFPSPNVRLLVNADATHDNIIKAIESLGAIVTANDLLYVFFSGHGVVDRLGRVYLMPYEADENDPATHGIKIDAFFQELQAQITPAYVVAFIDACHAGAAYTQGAEKGGENVVFGLNRTFYETYQSQQGIRMGLLASSSAQESNEADEFHHGVFTHFLLEGLKGGAPPDDKGVITAGAVSAYVSSQVDAYVRERGLRQQTPIPSPNFWPNFPLASLKPQATHICNPGDLQDCSAQCDRGNAWSCFNLGDLLANRGPENAPRAAALFRRACDGGVGVGCTTLGAWYLRGIGVPVDPARTAGLYEQGCSGGDMTSCGLLGNLYWQGLGVPKDTKRAFDFAKKACDGRSPPGCMTLGRMFEHGVGVSKDVAHAAELYAWTCDARDPEACLALGMMAERGVGVAIDKGRAVVLYTEACDDGEATGCTYLGDMYLAGIGLMPDSARAVGFYRRACSGGDIQGCQNLVTRYAATKERAEEAAEVARSYKKLCENGDRFACVVSGIFSERGVGGPQDVPRATQLYDKACTDGVPIGCYALGAIHQFGSSRDLARAVTEYGKACDGGDMEGCNSAALLYQKGGPGFSKDIPREIRLLNLACENGLNVSCANIGELYEAGLGVPRDVSRAVALYKDACDGGEVYACANLAAMYARGSGVAQDVAQAEALYKRSNALDLYTENCETEGDGHSCFNLAEMYRTGQGGAPNDLTRAAKLYERACANGESAACGSPLATRGR